MPRTHLFQPEARRGQIRATGSTQAAAKAMLAAATDHLCEHGANGPHVECRFGMVLVVYATPFGFAFTIVDPNHIAQGKRVHTTTSLGAADDIAAAVDEARNAACQRAWSPNVDDAALIAESGVSAKHAAELAGLFAHYRLAAA